MLGFLLARGALEMICTKLLSYVIRTVDVKISEMSAVSCGALTMWPYFLSERGRPCSVTVRIEIPPPLRRSQPNLKTRRAQHHPLQEGQHCLPHDGEDRHDSVGLRHRAEGRLR